MANISRRTAIVASSIIFMITIVAATFRYGIKVDESDDQVVAVLDEKRVKMWYWCLSQPPGFEGCWDGFRGFTYNYQMTGRLAPEYLKAYLMFANNNQTMVDIHVCSLDPARCPPQTLKRLWDWVHESYLECDD